MLLVFQEGTNQTKLGLLFYIVVFLQDHSDSTATQKDKVTLATGRKESDKGVPVSPCVYRRNRCVTTRACDTGGEFERGYLKRTGQGRVSFFLNSPASTTLDSQSTSGRLVRQLTISVLTSRGNKLFNGYNLTEKVG